MSSDADEQRCVVCGVFDEDDVFLDIHIETGATEWRCEDHARTDTAFWWMPGDHASLLAPSNYPVACEDCGEAFDPTGGLVCLQDDGHGHRFERDVCLSCATADDLRRHGVEYVEYDYVPDMLVRVVRPVEHADGCLHIGEDTAYAPLGGYWIPACDELAEMDHPPKGELIRYPADADRGPSVVGQDEVPEWVNA